MSSFAALFGMLMLASALMVWLGLRTMHERALVVAVDSCREARLQLLDATVSLQRVRWAREGDQFGWLLDYGFDVSSDGQQRRHGHIRFHRGALLWVEVPGSNDRPDLWVVPGGRAD